MDDSKEDLAKYLSEAIHKDKHPLDLFVRKIVTNILLEFCIPWLLSCFEKYTEQDFHTKMADPYWNFVDDWQQNHSRRFKAFMLGARRLRYAYDFDSKAITIRVVAILNERQGWTVTDDESVRLYYTMEQLRQMIES